jgi:hypothetical protein
VFSRRQRFLVAFVYQTCCLSLGFNEQLNTGYTAKLDATIME